MIGVRKFPSRTADKFMMRMPDGMRDRLSALAKNNHRSMNAEIVARLLGSIGAEGIDTSKIGEDVSAYLTAEARLVISYRKLPDKKKKALLELLEDT